MTAGEATWWRRGVATGGAAMIVVLLFSHQVEFSVTLLVIPIVTAVGALASGLVPWDRAGRAAGIQDGIPPRSDQKEQP